MALPIFPIHGGVADAAAAGSPAGSVFLGREPRAGETGQSRNPQCVMLRASKTLCYQTADFERPDGRRIATIAIRFFADDAKGASGRK